METPQTRSDWVAENCNQYYYPADTGALYYHEGNPFRPPDTQPSKWTGYLLTGVQGSVSDWAWQDGNDCRGNMVENGHTSSPDAVISYYHEKCKWEPLLSVANELDECKYSFQLCSDWPKYPDSCPIDPYSGTISKPCSDFINTIPNPVQNPDSSTGICRHWWDGYDQNGRNIAMNYMREQHPEYPEAREMMLNCTQFKTSNNCMVDPATGAKMPECSHLKSSSTEGDNCRQWLSGLTQQEVDQVISTICINFPELVECKCVNRAQDPQYNEVKPVAPFPDACWFIPCAGTEPFWVKSTDTVAGESCPDNLCQVIFDASAEGDVTIDENYIYFNCDFSEESGETEPVPPSSEWGTLVTDQQLTRFFVLFFTSIGVLFLSLL